MIELLNVLQQYNNQPIIWDSDYKSDCDGTNKLRDELTKFLQKYKSKQTKLENKIDRYNRLPETKMNDDEKKYIYARIKKKLIKTQAFVLLLKYAYDVTLRILQMKHHYNNTN